MTAWSDLNRQIETCQKCPRLVEHCQKIAQVKRKQYLDEPYWGKPVPNFGRTRVPLLIVGLAPGAHGANRTGRMFTGDRSGDWLYRALHKAGFCNQPESTGLKDGLKLRSCAITAVCHCAPPDNKPTRSEIESCRGYLKSTIELCRPTVLLALGGIAWNAVADYSIGQKWLSRPRPKFGHAASVKLDSGRSSCQYVVGCYHPSQQNTFTGRLTETMLDQLMVEVKNLLAEDQ